MLRTIDLTEAEKPRQLVMTPDEWRHELTKPRAERMGLPHMPEDMSCTGADALRMSEEIARATSANAARRARDMANARHSATNR